MPKHVPEHEHGLPLAPRPIGPWRLALILWSVFWLIWEIFTLAIGAHPPLLIFPFIWVAHGLLLTVVLHGFVRKANDLRGALKWPAVVLTVIVMTAVQTYLDTTVAIQFGLWLMRLLKWSSPGGSVIFDNGINVRSIGTQITAMSYFWVFGCYALADSLMRSHERLSKASAEAQQAELAALRLRINPHFLFNALGGVSTLIRSGSAEEADRALMKLVEFYRDTLVQDSSRITTLSEELDMIESYLDIERIRFPDRLRVSLDIGEDTGGIRLPGFILQPLVENAVKHGVGSSVGMVEISITARVADGRLRLEVFENSSGARSEAPGTGTGLRNLRERLWSIYGDQARLETGPTGDGFRSVVEVPVGPVQVDA